MEEKPKRRWLRFSVRTLLIAVTVLCVWLGWQVSIVRERNAIIALMRSRQPYFSLLDNDQIVVAPPAPHPSWIRRLIGDKSRSLLNVNNLTLAEAKRVAKAFPEARLWGTPRPE